MTIEQLRSLHAKRPFSQFRIHMADGRHFNVEHPGFLAQSPTGRTLIVTRPNDSFEMVDMLLVTSLEVRNGHAGRGRRKS